MAPAWARQPASGRAPPEEGEIAVSGTGPRVSAALPRAPVLAEPGPAARHTGRRCRLAPASLCFPSSGFLGVVTQTGSKLPPESSREKVTFWGRRPAPPQLPADWCWARACSPVPRADAKRAVFVSLCLAHRAASAPLPGSPRGEVENCSGRRGQSQRPAGGGGPGLSLASRLLPFPL